MNRENIFLQLLKPGWHLIRTARLFGDDPVASKAWKIRDNKKNPKAWVHDNFVKELLNAGLLSRKQLEYHICRRNIKRLHGNDKLKRLYKAQKRPVKENATESS